MRSIIACLLLCLALPLTAHADPVNINTADAATLDRELKGIGPSRAAAIVAHRTQHGPFKSVDELALVAGIGQKVIDDNREVLRVDRPAGKAAPAGKTAPAGKAAPAAGKPANKPAAKPAGSKSSR
jgi:competence protein ComEA